LAGLHQEIKARQERCWRRPQIGKNHASQLFHFVRELANAASEILAQGDAWRIEKLPLGIEQPPVIAAPQSLSSDRPNAKIGASVGAPCTNEAQSVAPISKENEILP
jgi:hypothetical protein